jgi:8-oxo-dGTP diphosphatase
VSSPIEQTVVLLRRNNQIMLGLDKGKEQMGGGKRNGPGGHVEPDETIEECAIRECQDEVVTTPKTLQKVAEIHYMRPHSEKIGHLVVHIFFCREWEGEPTETEVMIPEWYDEDKIPYDKMWDSDRIWLPRALGGEVLRWTFHYDENDKVTYQDVERIETP